MLFNSIQFLIFFAAVLSVYFALPHKFRWAWLLGASAYFYFSLKPEYVFIVFVSILVNYLAGIKLSNIEDLKKRKRLLVLTILFNLGLLFAFKYLNFFDNSLIGLFSTFSIQFGPLFTKILLPVGISFYTFQNLSYIIDIFNKRINPERHLGLFALYVMYFPKFISGPVERPANLIPQFYIEQSFEYNRTMSGFKLMLWGFFKKIVIADRLAIIVNYVYSNPTDYSGIPLIVATVFFAFQLYADFSGYTDIALGASRVMGINLTNNFRRPYLSKTVSEFWKRWHISLSSWFQDYVFVPLYMAISKIRALASLNSSKKHTIAFIISLLIGETLLGLWHGANWTFVAFGAYYGIMISLYYLLRKYWDSMNSGVQIILTFIIATGAWIFFRANSISDALYIFTHLFSNLSLSFHGINMGAKFSDVIIAAISIVFLMIVDFMQEYFEIKKRIDSKPEWLKWAIYLGMALLILMFGVFRQVQFIYVQF